MKCPLSLVVSLLAVFALIAGAWSHGHAQARPRASELHSVVICGGAGAQTLLLDARGLPVQPENCAQGLCPDCLPVPPLAVTTAGGMSAPSNSSDQAMSFAASPVTNDHRHPAKLPRGPPALT